MPFALFAVAATRQQISLLCLVLYFIWRNKEPLKDIGWTRQEPVREAAMLIRPTGGHWLRAGLG